VQVNSPEADYQTAQRPANAHRPSNRMPPVVSMYLHFTPFRLITDSIEYTAPYVNSI